MTPLNVQESLFGKLPTHLNDFNASPNFKPGSERFFSGYSSFTLSSITNISGKFQFDPGMHGHFWMSSCELLGAPWVNKLPITKNYKSYIKLGWCVIAYAPLISFKTLIKWPPVFIATASFPSVIFQLLQYSRQHINFLAYGLLWWQKLFSIIFLSFSLRFVDFAVQLCFRFKFILQEVIWVKFDSGMIFLTNHNSLLRIAINEIASFCIDGLRQIAIFVFWTGPQMIPRSETIIASDSAEK